MLSCPSFLHGSPKWKNRLKIQAESQKERGAMPERDDQQPSLLISRRNEESERDRHSLPSRVNMQEIRQV
ncbi:hypothetical protein ACFX1W_029708 [Malus domestica]